MSNNDFDVTQLKERFGEQQFFPKSGFVLTPGQMLPELIWERPEWVAQVMDDITIPTRWFDADFEEVTTAQKSGRYYVYGEAPAPKGPALRRAMTCVCVGDVDLTLLAEKIYDAQHVEQKVNFWRDSEDGAVELAALVETGGDHEARVGQWQMENATRHVRLKRKLMGLDNNAPVEVRARLLKAQPAPVLRRGSLEEAGLQPAKLRDVERRLDDWYVSAQKPTAVVIARNGVIVLEKGYGKINGRDVGIETPMLLHSAMKPLMGLQLAMYVDRGLVKLDEPVGNILADFNAKQDQKLTFRAGHVHVSGIHFPWELAFSRLFYFHTWHESLIAHCKREWAPGARYRYGVVGIILAVRALELLCGKNYWDAMESELFEPLGITHMLPGGTGFSAEDLARIGVLLDNRGKYGAWELFSEATYQSIVPTDLKPYFSDVDKVYGIGLQKQETFGEGSYGHGGGCGTWLAVNPEKHLVFAMVRNERGVHYKDYLADVLGQINAWDEN